MLDIYIFVGGVMRILILSASTGGGHMKASAAIK